MRGGYKCFYLLLMVLAVVPSLQSQRYPKTSSTPPAGDDQQQRDPANMASTYVPLDSWVYPALERLSALGILQTSFVALRPWTRMECARLAAEAGDRLANDESNAEAS